MSRILTDKEIRNRIAFADGLPDGAGYNSRSWPIIQHIAQAQDKHTLEWVIGELNGLDAPHIPSSDIRTGLSIFMEQLKAQVKE